MKTKQKETKSLFDNREVITAFLSLYIKASLFLNSENTLLKNFSCYIISKCDEWFSILYIDEVELLEYRYFDNMKYADIAAILNYRGHSGAKNKEFNIIIKIISHEQKVDT